MMSAMRTGGRSRSAPLPGASERMEQMEVDEEELPLLGRRRRGGSFRTGLLATGMAALVFGVGIIVGRLSSSVEFEDVPRRGESTRQRASQPPPPPHTGADQLFDQFSPVEIRAIAEAVQAKVGAAGSPALIADSKQPFIAGTGGINLWIPDKAEGIIPPRYARVQVARPEEGDVVEYKVGPITGRETPVVEDVKFVACPPPPLLEGEEAAPKVCISVDRSVHTCCSSLSC